MDPQSPGQQSQRVATNILSVLMYLLAGLFAILAILFWTIDEASDAVQRGWIFAGSSLLVAAFGRGLSAWSSRPPAPPQPEDLTPTRHFHRRLLGAVWLDWLALLLPLVLTSPLLFLSKRPLLESGLLCMGFTVLLQLIILPAILSERKTWVEITLHAEGVTLATRGGRQRHLRFGQLRGLRLGFGQARNFRFGTLEFHLGESTPIVFREPMNRPLPQIAASVAAHMQVPVDDQWSRDGAASGPRDPRGTSV
jgi:hypothetical protein